MLLQKLPELTYPAPFTQGKDHRGFTRFSGDLFDGICHTLISSDDSSTSDTIIRDWDICEPLRRWLSA